MPDPASRTLRGKTEIEHLQTALAEARAELAHRDAAVLKLEGEVRASRMASIDAQREAAQLRRLLHGAEETAAVQARAEIEAVAASRDAEIRQLREAIAAGQAEVAALAAGMDRLRASASWRLSAPVRMAGRLLRGFRSRASRAIRRIPASRTEPAAPPPPTFAPPAASVFSDDPNACATFRPAACEERPSPEAEGVVTLDALYHLSRSL